LAQILVKDDMLYLELFSKFKNFETFLKKSLIFLKKYQKFVEVRLGGLVS
jgi:hypothetical protein